LTTWKHLWFTFQGSRVGYNSKAFINVVQANAI